MSEPKPTAEQLLRENLRLGTELRNAAETNGKLLDELAALRKFAKKAERMYGIAEMGRRHAEEERIRFLDERDALREENKRLRDFAVRCANDAYDSHDCETWVRPQARLVLREETP